MPRGSPIPRTLTGPKPAQQCLGGVLHPIHADLAGLKSGSGAAAPNTKVAGAVPWDKQALFQLPHGSRAGSGTRCLSSGSYQTRDPTEELGSN